MRAAPIYGLKDLHLSEEIVERLEERASSHWDAFYHRNAANFFRDRHYLARESLALQTTRAINILEVGCGAGNTAFPLLDDCPAARIYACDFAPEAIKLIKEHPKYALGRVTAFVADVTKDNLIDHIPHRTVDVCTMIFVLSAISPSQLPKAIRNVASVLNPAGGQIFVRDYADGDLAQTRLSQARHQRALGPGFFARGDGTRAFYFTQVGLRALFEAEDFRCDSIVVLERTISNRARGASMERRWIQAAFTLDHRHAMRSAQPPHSAISPFTAQPAPAAEMCQPSTAGVSMPLGERSATSCKLWADLSYGVCGPPSAALTTKTPDAPPARAASPAAPAQPLRLAEERHEWEACAPCAADGGPPEEALLRLFDEGEPAAQPQWLRVEGFGEVEVVAVPREHRHTLAHTGLMVWEGSLALARLVAACPGLFHGQHVLELGCGASPLVALAALRSAARVVCSDGSITALALLQANIARNSHRVVVERLRILQLAWGDARNMATAVAEAPSGFDAVLGADIVYSSADVPHALACCRHMLKPGSQGYVLLCHVTRSIGEEELVSIAQRVGLNRIALSPGLQRAAHMTGILSGPMRLLLFALTV